MKIKEASELFKIKKHIIGGKIGVYFIYDWNDKLVYIGQSTNLIKRIHGHSNKTFRFYRYIECKREELILLERLYIKRYKPRFNKKYNDEILHQNKGIDEFFLTINEGEILVLKEFDKFIFKTKLPNGQYRKYHFDLSDLPRGRIGLLEYFGRSFYIWKENNKLYVDEV